MPPLDLRRGYRAYRTHVNPVVAVRAELVGEPLEVMAVADDGRLVLGDGRVVEDLLAGWGTQALGHRPAVVELALADFLAGRAAAVYPSMVSPYAGLLAERLAARTGHDAAWFASGGTEAVEAALKLARAATGRPRILCLDGAYHGCTMGSLAMMARGPYTEPFAPHVPAIERLPFGDVAALERALGPDVAAVVVEPVQVEGGIRSLPAPWLAALCELAPRAGALVVADEIQTGLGRTGRFLASDAWPRRPDVVTLGKALGGGLVPISALLTSRRVWDRAYGSHATAELHASTYAGNALACVAALATVEAMDDALIERAREVGGRFRAALADALDGLALVREVRGDGLLVGIELRPADHPWLTFEYLGLEELAGRSPIGLLLVHRLLREGYGTHVCGHDWTTVRLQPPLGIPEERLGAFVAACRREVEALCRLAA